MKPSQEYASHVQVSEADTVARAKAVYPYIIGKLIDVKTARRLEYRFALHQHPYVTQLTREFILGAVPQLQAADTELRPPLEQDFFAAAYTPAKAEEDYAPAAIPETGVFVEKEYPRYELDLSPGGGYAVYNWELFFHIPLAIGMHLSRNQRFEEAEQWLHYIFDPTATGDEPSPQRYWKFKRFKTTQAENLVAMLTNLSSNEDMTLRNAMVDSIDKWRESPFSPHAVARARPAMYMEKTFMMYLDNLIAWGDYLFQQDATETIDEALSLYVRAARLLGARPQKIPRAGTMRPQTYASIRADLDEFSNVLREIESDIPFDLVPNPTAGGATPGSSPETDSLGRSLYFCVPANDKLLGYWDTVADRLFKIRNSLNFRGIFRELPLFDPPIDPAMLARAAAAGVDIAAVVAGLNQPLPTVRFVFLIQKAMSVCQEAKALGSQLLGAIEKDDAEALVLMRSRHERQMLELAEAVKYGQAQESGKQFEALERSLKAAIARYVYFERLLGRVESDIKLPDFVALDVDGLLNLKFQSTEPELDERNIDIDIAQDAAALAAGKLINRYEARELLMSAAGREAQTAASVIDLIGGILGLIPQFDAHATPIGVGAAVGFGGVQLAQMMHFMSSTIRIGADIAMGDAALAAKIGGFARREQEWAYQSNNIAAEIGQIYKQLRAAEIRKALADRELSNHRQQIKNAVEADTFLTDDRNGKEANKALYNWMKRELKGLYARSFSYALEVASKAQRALQHELGDNEAQYITGNYTRGPSGLLAGELLMADLQRMEIEYHENNPAALKPVVHVSLADLDPLALLQLRATGRCTLSIPEAYLDMTGPGEYFRRIKSVSCSVPCIAGSFVGVHCKLTLRNSTIRRTAALPGGVAGYTRSDTDDERFDDYRGLIQSVVVSGAAGDTGTVDDGDAGVRSAPFEYCGVVGEWGIELPADPSKGEPTAFDYGTITDVVLSIRYTARDGGDELKKVAMGSLVQTLREANAAGAARLFSMRQDFPEAWARFKGGPAPTANAFARLELTLTDRHFPFWARGWVNTIARSMMLAPQGGAVKIRQTQTDAAKDDTMGHLFGEAGKGVMGTTLEKNPVAMPGHTTTWLLSDNSMSDLWVYVGWQG